MTRFHPLLTCTIIISQELKVVFLSLRESTIIGLTHFLKWWTELPPPSHQSVKLTSTAS